MNCIAHFKLTSLLAVLALGPIAFAETNSADAVESMEPANPTGQRNGQVRGITEPYKDSVLSTTVMGRISKIHIDEGQQVKRGEVIIALESEPQALEVRRRELILKSKVELESAKAQMQTLKLDFDATKKLFKTTGSVSKEELMEKELEYKIAKAAFEGLKLAEKREEIELNIAKSDFNLRMIKAPYDGLVAKIFLQEGENCNPQEPLIRLVDTAQCKFLGYVDEHNSHLFKRGVKVKVKAQSHKQRFDGELVHVSPVIDPSSGLQEIKILFDNSKGQVCPGVNAVVSVHKGEQK